MFTRSSVPAIAVLLAALFAISGPAAAIDDAHYAKAEKTIEKGIAYLRSTQNEDGSWSPEVGPAITALAVTAMLDQPTIDADDPYVKKGIDYILSRQKVSGGIYDEFLDNYNTAICISALSRVKGQPRVAAALDKAEGYLRGMQWRDRKGPEGKTIDSDVHNGGVGYGKHGRPDGSNTNIFVDALYDLGVECTDPAIQDAAAFFATLQGIESNKVHGDRIEHDGGAIYAGSINKDLVGVPQSMASPELIEAAKAGEKDVRGLRTYGSMTYAMFKSYVYAQLPREDPRVKEAVKWIRNNYTLEQNPGMPDKVKMQGYFYYLLTMSRALNAWNSDITGKDGERIEWDNDLVDKLTELQREDGSWVNEADRWTEGNPDLVTAYSVIALTEAAR